MAGYIFFRSGTGLSNTDSFGRNRFSDVCVWEMLCTIPYGETTTYGAIAKQIAHDRGISKMSSQAVGNAIGRNPVSVIVPCHRVIGAKGNLTGYAGGIERKAELLKIEQNQNATEQYPF